MWVPKLHWTDVAVAVVAAAVVVVAAVLSHLAQLPDPLVKAC